MASVEEHQSQIAYISRRLTENAEDRLTISLVNLEMMMEDEPTLAAEILVQAMACTPTRSKGPTFTNRAIFEILGKAWLCTEDQELERIFAWRMINGTCLVSGEGCPEAQALRKVLDSVDKTALPKLRRFITLATSEGSTVLSPTIRVAAHACIKVMNGAELKELFKES